MPGTLNAVRADSGAAMADKTAEDTQEHSPVLNTIEPSGIPIEIFFRIAKRAEPAILSEI
jgi:hypothetical protein